MKTKPLFIVLYALLVFTIATILAACADLVIIHFSAPDTADAGEEVALEIKVRNVGPNATIPSSNWTVALYLSVDKHKGQEDLWLTSIDGPALSPGEAFSASPTVQIPPGIATGKYYLLAFADDNGAAGDTPDHNNLEYQAIQISGTPNDGIDLVPTNIFVAEEAVSGTNLNIHFSLYNRGLADAPASYTDCYLSSDQALDPGSDLYLGSVQAGPLASGHSTEISLSAFIESVNVAQNQYLLLKADGISEISEFDESNNSIYRRLRISPNLPDLAFVMLNSPIGISAGTDFIIKSRLINMGPKASQSFQLAYVLSEDESLGNADDRALQAYATSALNASQTIDLLHNVSMPADVSDGTYYLFAVIDPNNDILEMTQNNNTEALRICIHEELGNELAERREGETPRQSTQPIVFEPGQALSNQFLELFLEEEFKAYPNPTRGPLHTSFALAGPTEVSLSILDMHGRKLHSLRAKYQPGRHLRTLYFPDVPAGQYLLKAEVAGEWYTKVVVVQ